MRTGYISKAVLLLAAAAGLVCPSVGYAQDPGANAGNQAAQAASPVLTSTPSVAENQHTKRVGLAMQTAQPGPGNLADTTSAPARTLLIQYLSQQRLEIAPLSATTSPQFEAEAKSKGCEYVLYSSITRKKANGMG